MGQRLHFLIVASVAGLLTLAACGRTAPDVAASADPTVESTPVTATTTTIATTTTTAATGSIHVVQPGDSLGKIAKAFDLSAATLAEYNSMDNPDRIRVGDVINIPPGATSTSTTPTTAAAPPADVGVTETTSGLAEPVPAEVPADPGAAEQGGG